MESAEFKVGCCDPYTGHLTDEQGVEAVGNGRLRHWVAVFDDAEQAKAHARGIVSRCPIVECWVTGPGVEWSIRDEQWLERAAAARGERERLKRRQRRRWIGVALTVVIVVVVAVL